MPFLVLGSKPVPKLSMNCRGLMSYCEHPASISCFASPVVGTVNCMDYVCRIKPMALEL